MPTHGRWVARSTRGGAANHGIGDTGATALAKGVKESKTLTILNLEGEPRAGVARVLSAILTPAVDAENKIGDVGATALAESMKTLTTLLLWSERRRCVRGLHCASLVIRVRGVQRTKLVPPARQHSRLA